MSGPTYPQLASKHSSDPIITPEQNLAYRRAAGLLPDAPVPHGVILCYQHSVLDHVLGQEGSADGDIVESHRGLLLLPSTGHRVGVMGGFGYGAPAATLLLEELIALGVSDFISLGTAGGLQASGRIGDLVVCDRAVRDEGVSHHYLPNELYANGSEALTARLTAELRRRGEPFTIGSSWTIDTPYR